MTDLIKPTVFAIQGYNSDGKYMEKLAPYYEPNFKFIPYSYGEISHTPILKHFINTVANRWRYKTVMDCLINLIRVEKLNCPERDIHLVTHSNGTLIAYGAAQATKQVKSVTSFNGALDANTQFPCHVTNFYCTTDWTVKGLARMRIGHPWGGYGSQPNDGALNIRLDDYGVKGHSDFLEHLDKIMPAAIGNMPV